MKKQFLLFSFAFAMVSNVTTTLAFDEHTLFDTTNVTARWSFIEKKFITDISAAKQASWSYYAPVLPAILIATAASNLVVTEGKNLLAPYNGGIGGIVLGTTLITMPTLESRFSNKANQNAVVDFFSNWDQNQNYVPAELFETFQLIAETMESKGQKAIAKSANEIVEAVRFVVTRYFDKRYENVLKAKADTALADAKTFAEIIKNAVEAVTKLGGGK